MNARHWAAVLIAACVLTNTAQAAPVDSAAFAAMGLQQGSPLSIDPVMLPLGAPSSFTASVFDTDGNLVAGLLIQFDILSGPNQGTSASAVTGANGRAEFSYAGSGGVGVDMGQARFQDGGVFRSNILQVTWFDPAVTVPEPSTLLLVVASALGMLAARRRRH